MSNFEDERRDSVGSTHTLRIHLCRRLQNMFKIICWVQSLSKGGKAASRAALITSNSYRNISAVYYLVAYRFKLTISILTTCVLHVCICGYYMQYSTGRQTTLSQILAKDGLISKTNNSSNAYAGARTSDRSIDEENSRSSISVISESNEKHGHNTVRIYHKHIEK